MSIQSMEQLEPLVAQRMQPDFTYAQPTIETFSPYEEPTDIAQDPAAFMDRVGFRMRLEGSYILACSLKDKQGNLVPVLYTPPDPTAGKLNASHVMSPAGPHNGPGGQHGLGRWVDYIPDSPEKLPSSVAMYSDTPKSVPLIERSIDLIKDGTNDYELCITSALHNQTPSEIFISLGEHLYFSLPDGKAEGLRIGLTEDTLAEPDNLADIMDGKMQFWDDFDGEAVVDFPDGKRILIQTRTHGSSTNAPLGMLLWHRPDTESICIEPTIGYRLNEQGEIQNDLLAIAGRSAIALGTDIRLLS